MGKGFLDITVKVDFKQEKLVRAVEAAKEKPIKRGAAILRGIMRRLIRKKTGPSPVGTPPHAHTDGGGLKNLIFFEYDRYKKEAVVGPALSRGSRGNPAPVPAVLNKGGPTRVRLPKALQRKLGKKSVIARVRPRPFTEPALDKFKGSYPELFREIVK